MHVQDNFVLVPREVLRLVLDQAEQSIGAFAPEQTAGMSESLESKLSADRIEVLRRCAGFITTVSAPAVPIEVAEVDLVEA